MFSKHETDKNNIFVNTIKVDKKKKRKVRQHHMLTLKYQRMIGLYK